MKQKAFAVALPIVSCCLAAAACSPALIGSNRRASTAYTHVPPSRVMPADYAASTAPSELPPRPRLHDYLSVALARNPRLARARREAEAMGFEIAQATGLPDPSLTLVPPTGDHTETAAGRVESSIGVSQKLPFPAKLWIRGKAATHGAAAGYEAYRGELLQLVADTRRAYYMLYFADRSMEITTKSRDLLRSFRDIATRMYETGAVPQQDVLRAQVELANLEKDLVVLRQMRGTAAARLNQLMSYPSDAVVPPTAPIKPHRVQVTLAELLDKAAERNPEIGAAKERVEKARAALDLANLEYLPDLTIGYQYTEISGSGLSPVANGDDNWQLNVGVTLPIWFERLNAGRGSAAAALSASREALTDARDATAFRIEEALLRVEAEQRLVDLFGGVIIPQARQTLDATVSAYRAGQVDFLTFIENWRKLLEFEVSYEKSLSTFEQELAELERLVGEPIANAGAGREVGS